MSSFCHSLIRHVSKTWQIIDVCHFWYKVLLIQKKICLTLPTKSPCKYDLIRQNLLIFYHVTTFPKWQRVASKRHSHQEISEGKVGKLEIDPTGVGFKAVCRFVPTARFSFCLVRFPKLCRVEAGLLPTTCACHTVFTCQNRNKKMFK